MASLPYPLNRLIIRNCTRQNPHGRVGMAGMVYLSKHSKSLFRDTEWPFCDTERPFGDTERTFGDTERRVTYPYIIKTNVP